MPKSNHPSHAGPKPLFTMHLTLSLIDLKSLREEIEKAQAMGERATATPRERQAWRRYRDLLEKALDVRIDLLDADVQSHEAAIDASGTCPPMCRAGTQTDPPRGELRRLAMARARETAAGADTPTAA